ncbi:hypothetical protein JW905_14000 [bacterium]|nr:hypothetical protein [candidate division CSSED10-310 bacterium]
MGMARENNPVGSEVLEWTVQPVRRQPVRGLLVGAFCLLIWGIVWLWTRNPLFVALSVLFLTVSIAQFYLPVHYRLTEEGAERIYLGFSVLKPWGYFRSIYTDRSGVFLSPFVGRSFFESYRGMYLRAQGNSEEIAEYVRKKMAPDTK